MPAYFTILLFHVTHFIKMQKIFFMEYQLLKNDILTFNSSKWKFMLDWKISHLHKHFSILDNSSLFHHKITIVFIRFSYLAAKQYLSGITSSLFLLLVPWSSILFHLDLIIEGYFHQTQKSALAIKKKKYFVTLKKRCSTVLWMP